MLKVGMRMIYGQTTRVTVIIILNLKTMLILKIHQILKLKSGEQFDGKRWNNRMEHSSTN